jgi:hypothetical protein
MARYPGSRGRRSPMSCGQCGVPGPGEITTLWTLPDCSNSATPASEISSFLNTRGASVCGRQVGVGSCDEVVTCHNMHVNVSACVCVSLRV